MKNNRKKVILSVGCILAAVSVSACISGSADISDNNNSSTFVICALETPLMQINGDVVEKDSVPFLYDNTTYIPIRAVTEAFNADVEYVSENSTVFVSLNNQTEKFSISDGIMYKDRTYFPVRELVERFGFDVEWYDGLITISNDDIILDEEAIAEAKTNLQFEDYKDRKTAYSVAFSVPAGLYTDAFELNLTTEMPEAQIHYTTDGSEPTINSPLYSGSIYITDRSGEANNLVNIRTADEDFVKTYNNVFKGTTIKARAFDTSGTSSPISVSSYFVNKNIFSRYGVKVVSITTPEENLFDSETGIYTPENCSKKGSDWERAAYMEVFDTDGTCNVSQTVGLRISGAFTRKYQQKSLRVYARKNDEYVQGGNKSFNYDFFDGTVTDNTNTPISTYKTIILRNSGDDWYNNFIRDSIVEKLAKQLNVDTMGYNPSVVFINGEYWGVHEIRERYDASYFKQHYNLSDSKDVAMVEIGQGGSLAELSEGNDDDLEDFNSKAYFVINNDMKNTEYYQKACTYFDVDNLIDYYCVNIYFENNDWPFNNVKIWKNKNEENAIDTRWRWIISDEDGTFSNLGDNIVNTGTVGKAALKRWNVDGTGALGYLLEDEDCLMQKIFSSFLENDEFKEKFKSRYAECISTYFSADTVAATVEEMAGRIAPLRAEHKLRYPNSWNEPSYSQLISYAKNRPSRAMSEYNNYFK